MSSSQASTLGPNDLIALSREIQAMIDAGVPLDLGLTGASGGFSRRLEAVSQRVAERMTSGASLPDALEEESAIPPLYRAVVVAGLRCGRSHDVLEDICQMTAAFQSLRQALARGLVYPAVVVLFAGGLFAVVATTYIPALTSLYRSISAEVPPWLLWFEGSRVPEVLLLSGPVLLAVLLLVARGGRSGRAARGLGWIPRVLQDVRLARTSQILSLLTGYGIPLPEALRLTADTADSGQLRSQLLELAAAVEGGEPFERAVDRQGTLPPFLRWLIVTGTRNSSLSETLKRAGDYYRGRALARANLLRAVVPALAMILVGGSVTFLYALSVLGPMTELWKRLAEPG